MRRWFRIPLSMLSTWVLVAALLLSGCAAPSNPSEGAAAEQGDPLPVVSKKSAGTVLVEGLVAPARSSYLSFEIPGDVVEVGVEIGDRVEAGDLLVQLDTQELTWSLQSTEQDVIAQKAALEQLLDGASEKVIARADKSNRDQMAQAEVALLAKQLQLEKAQAEDPSIGVTAAEARLKQLQLQLAQAQAQDPGPAVTIAEVGVERARIALTDTQDEYNKALDRPWEDQAIRDGWAKLLEQAQLDYRLAQAQLKSALDSQKAHAVGLDVIATQIEEAKTQLAQAIIAQQTYSTTLDILAADVKAARLQLEALKTWDNPYRDEASEQEVAQLEARVQKAEIAVKTLKLKMEDAKLSTPFAGTVVEVLVEVGDKVSPGQVVIVLATLDQLEVRTTDLTELDVARVAIGQAAVVWVDALPDREFTGVVSEIALQGKDYRGDVVYEVVLALDKESDELRWGMTTEVEIQTQ